VSSRSDRRSEVLIFVHIPKTAGTTFAVILERNFRPSRVVNVYPNFGISTAELPDLPAAIRQRVECVQGHFDYGLHRILGRPFRYATFLRHPVEQARSRYHHARSSRFHPLHHLARECDSLEEFVRISPDNYQTRTLAGVEPIPGRGHPTLTEQHLEQVKQNVERHFALVGITERFDESLVLARRSLGLERIHYVNRNVRRRPGRDPSLSGSPRQVVEDHSRLDLKLYDWARGRHEEAIEADRESFERELREFQEANARYARLLWPVDALSHRAIRAARYLRRLLRRPARGR
jgi:hypothetical protein